MADPDAPETQPAPTGPPPPEGPVDPVPVDEQAQGGSPQPPALDDAVLPVLPADATGGPVTQAESDATQATTSDPSSTAED